jgi:serine/threonine protein kinase
MESLHSKGFLHRDIKPHNFMIDRKKNSEQLYIVDFGLSRKYRSRTGDHIPFKNNRSLIGTARYASINMHNGIEPTRRDDLESIGYMLVYLIKGRLPWQGLKKQEGIPGVKLIGEKKKEVELDDLCSELPKCFLKYLIYCRSLDFDEQPDYAKLKQYFLNDISSLKIELKYDWER